MSQVDQLRSMLQGMWATVAPHWGEHADYVDARGAEVTAAMIEATEPRPGERVLELACGPGSVGLAAAPLVAPDGEVVLSDAVAEMTALALQRAEGLGRANVRAKVIDLDAIDEPDDAYEVVVCREGLMFALDPGQAVREIRRVLRPGGRTALAVWGQQERNPWLGLVLDAVSEQLGQTIPPPGIPGPFALSDAARLQSLLHGAGLVDAAVTELAVPLHAPSFDEWWGRTTALAGPLAAILDGLPAEVHDAVRGRLRDEVQPYASDAGLTFPGETLLATAVK